MLKPSYLILPLLIYAILFMFQTLPPAPKLPTITRTYGPIISLPPSNLSRHTATVIFLHGLGDTGNGWAPVSKDLALHLPHVKFLFPTAPTRNITVNMGMSMPGWFDIAHLDINSLKDMMEGKPADENGIEESVAYIHQLVDIEIKSGIPRHRIVVGGFSQGGHVRLTFRPLKLIASYHPSNLTTYLPTFSSADCSQNSPVFPSFHIPLLLSPSSSWLYSSFHMVRNPQPQPYDQ